jgi:formylglycine-generating enzyme required for sulfatase activity
MANTWQGEFPWQNLLVDGHEGTSPVGSFPSNGYGLVDVTGNVGEGTSDYYSTPRETGQSCCVPSNPRVTSPDASLATGGEPGSNLGDAQGRASRTELRSARTGAGRWPRPRRRTAGPPTRRVERPVQDCRDEQLA